MKALPPTSRRPLSTVLLLVGGLLAAIVPVSAAAETPGTARDTEDRLGAMRREIARLREDLGGLQRRESGLLGELRRLETEARLREAEMEEVTLRLRQTGLMREERSRELARMEEEQARRARYLALRLRELYKRGHAGPVQDLVGGARSGDALRALRFAAYLGERDARTLRDFRGESERIGAEREALAREEARLAELRREAGAARSALGRARSERSARLKSVRGDRRQHESALTELEVASRQLEILLGELGPASATPPELDVRKFRGLLDTPAPGRVSTPFGNRVHPRFRTVIPHPGWDIDAREGERFAAVFDGRIAYASWLHGYGLTVILDHGNGVMSVYAHASALFVEVGEDVLRGQVLGTVGDTGSLRGTLLYFEIRERGKPVDPASWIRRP